MLSLSHSQKKEKSKSISHFQNSISNFLPDLDPNSLDSFQPDPIRSDLMSSDTSSGGDSTGSKVGGVSGGGSASVPSPLKEKQKEKEKARVSRTSSILWHAHQNDAGAVRKLLEEDRTLVNARDYDNRTPLHVASLHGWIEVAKCLIDYGADVNAQDRWKNTVKKKKNKNTFSFTVSSSIFAFFAVLISVFFTLFV